MISDLTAEHAMTEDMETGSVQDVAECLLDDLGVFVMNDKLPELLTDLKAWFKEAGITLKVDVEPVGESASCIKPIT